MARRIGSDGAKTAEALRLAALGLFARHGFAAVSMRRIADEVGVQPGALYNHVATKQDLLADLMVAHLEGLLAAWERAPLPDDPAAALEAFTRFHVRYHLGRADEVFISYMELRNLEPENFAAVEALRQRYEAILRAILARGAASGAFATPDAPVAARAIIAMLTGVTGWFREGGRLSARQIEDIYTDMALRSVAAAPAHSKEAPCSTQA